MAFTVTTNKKTVFGDMRVHILDVAADAATQTVATGLSFIDGFSLGPQSMATSAFSLLANVDAVGAAANGSFAVTGVASGDTFFITVYGR